MKLQSLESALPNRRSQALLLGLAGLLCAGTTVGCEPRTDGLTEPTEELAESPATGPASLAAPAGTQVQGGLFSMSADDVEVDPAGCRTASKGDWSFDLPAPVAENWTGTEHFEQHSTPYECEGNSTEFECTSRSGFDYAVTGVDADVELIVTYGGSWTDAESIAGSFDLVFTCAGEACGQVAPQWTVSSFPCANSGAFEGSLQ